MKLLAILACAIAAAAQTPAPVSSIANMTLPAYIAGGGAYNQLAGLNFWASAIVPVSSTAGVYESTTTDLFPVKAVVSGKTAYIFQTSVREGVHKVLHQDPSNMVLFGADAGFSFAQASAAGSATSGVSAAVTITYVRQLSPTFALMVPIRALYMPTLGGWNPIVEFGIVWKPGAK
jgi:hypothetical protein